MVDVANGGGKLRVIAGSSRGVKGPAKTFTPVNVFDVELDASHEFEFSIPPKFTGAIVVLRGRLVVNRQETVKDTEVLLFANEGELVTARDEQDTRLLVLSGEPIDEPIAAYGPFVMNTEKESEQAIADYRAGRLGTIGIRIERREAIGT